MGFGDASGSKRSTAKTYLVDAQARGRRDLRRRRAERILVEDGRAAGVEAVWTDPAAPAGNGAGERARLTVRAPVVVVACGLDPVAGAAAALRDRRPGRRRLPAPAPDRRGHRVLRRAPELDVGAAAGGALAPVRRHRRRLRLPDRVRAGDHRAVRRRAAVALGRRPQAAHAPSGRTRRRSIGVAARARPRPGRDRRRRQPGRPLSDRQRARHRRTSALGGRAARARPRGGRGAGDRRQRHRKAPDWTRGDDLEAFIAALNGLAIVPREYVHLLGPPDGQLPDGRATRRPRSRTRGASSTTRPGSGSATRAPSRAPREPTRWRRSWPWRGAPRTRSPSA